MVAKKKKKKKLSRFHRLFYNTTNAPDRLDIFPPPQRNCLPTTYISFHQPTHRHPKPPPQWQPTRPTDRPNGNGNPTPDQPLSDHDFKIYNRMADRMEQFHNYFRQSWTLLHTAATTSRRPQNLSLKQFLSQGISFAEHLNAHHSIEEAHIFPLLATRMPEFHPKRGPLVKQHGQIHKGLEAFEDYVRRCHRGDEHLEMATLKEKMDSWGAVLWEHLDGEVRMLGAERMRRVWSREEMMRMPM